jgi:hypothetical protein
LSFQRKWDQASEGPARSTLVAIPTTPNRSLRKSNWLNTIALGIRKNRASDSDVRTGGVLVVGNSFAIGSQVNDEETWPAHLGSPQGSQRYE